MTAETVEMQEDSNYDPVDIIYAHKWIRNSRQINYVDKLWKHLAKNQNCQVFPVLEDKKDG